MLGPGAQAITDDALTSVSVTGLRLASVTSLRIARVAMLYLHALVTVHERQTAPAADAGIPQLPISEYGKFLSANLTNTSTT